MKKKLNNYKIIKKKLNYKKNLLCNFKQNKKKVTICLKIIQKINLKVFRIWN